MAKFFIGKKRVSCDILNESKSEYLVRFKDGVITNVNKRDVTDLNVIDEGVLDAIKSGARNVGRKISIFFGLFIEKFKANGFIFFRNAETGEVLNTSHPVNAMLAAKRIDGVGFYPSTNMSAAIKLLGETPVVVEDVDDDDDIIEELDEAFDIDDHPFVTLTGRDPDENLDINQPQSDLNRKEVERAILIDVESVREGDRPAAVLCIWGAPGIGKTAIIESIVEAKEKSGNRFSIIDINARTIKPDDFTLPGYETDEITGRRIATDYIKNWLPHYNPRSKYSKYEDEIANGTVFKEGVRRETAYKDNSNPYMSEIDESLIEVKGDGGIIFIDELSRINEDVLKVIMSLFSDGKVGTTSELIGSKWVVIAAGNRKNDMEGVSAAFENFLDLAGHSRLRGVNYVPTYAEWREWATSTSEKTGYQNIIPEIIEFLDNKHYKDYWFYSRRLSKDDSHFNDNRADKASPRTWAELSRELRRMKKLDNVNSYDELNCRAVRVAATSTLGNEVGNAFTDYLFSTSVFSAEYAENIWLTGVNDRKKFNATVPFMAIKGYDVLIENAPNGGKPSDNEFINVEKFLFSVAYGGIGGKGSDVASYQALYKEMHEAWAKVVHNAWGIDIDRRGSKIINAFTRLANDTVCYDVPAMFPQTKVDPNKLYFADETADLYTYNPSTGKYIKFVF